MIPASLWISQAKGMSNFLFSQNQFQFPKQLSSCNKKSHSDKNQSRLPDLGIDRCYSITMPRSEDRGGEIGTELPGSSAVAVRRNAHMCKKCDDSSFFFNSGLAQQWDSDALEPGVVLLDPNKSEKKDLMSKS